MQIDARFIFNEAINVQAVSRWRMGGGVEEKEPPPPLRPRLDSGIAGLFPIEILIVMR